MDLSRPVRVSDCVMPRLAVVLALFATCAAIAPVTAHGGNAGAGDDPGATPFDFAVHVPADVSVYLHLTDAGALRTELADCPIFDWITAVLNETEVKEAWRVLAARVNIPPQRLFDLCFGREMTFIKRSGDGQPIEWALVTHMPPRRMTRLLERLEPKALRPRFGAAVFEVPEHELLLVRRETRMLIGPAGESTLLFDIARRMHEPEQHGETALDRTPAFEKRAAMQDADRASLGLYLRHAPPMGGWSLAAAAFDDERIRVQHHAAFDASPFSREPTGTTIDSTPLAALEDHALLAFVEPTDIGRSAIETFFLASIGEGLMSRSMRERLGDRRIIVFGEVEGRQEEEPIDLQAPTIALVLEMGDAPALDEELDRQMVRLAAALNELGADRFEIDVPSLESLRADGSGRSVDLSAAMQWLAGELPLVQPVSLNWAVSDNPHGRYCVFASHPMELRGTLAALERGDDEPQAHEQPVKEPAEHGEKSPGNYQHCGIANGVRIAHHLDSWAEQAHKLADPAHQDEFKDTVRLLSHLARGMERVRWRLARPKRHTMILEIDIRLTPPESTRAE